MLSAKSTIKCNSAKTLVWTPNEHKKTIQKKKSRCTSQITLLCIKFNVQIHFIFIVTDMSKFWEIINQKRKGKIQTLLYTAKLSFLFLLTYFEFEIKILWGATTLHILHLVFVSNFLCWFGAQTIEVGAWKILTISKNGKIKVPFESHRNAKRTLIQLIASVGHLFLSKNLWCLRFSHLLMIMSSFEFATLHNVLASLSFCGKTKVDMALL